MSEAAPEPGRVGDSGLEIERKFLLHGIPDMPRAVEVWRIEQGYLSAVPLDASIAAANFARGRIRRIALDDGSIRYTHTIKSGAGLVRFESEQTITPEQFHELWPRTKGRRLRKVRHRVLEHDLVWEIDIFESINLVMAEVELPTVDTALSIPLWLKKRIAREVTDDPLFTNANIAVGLIQQG